MGRRERRSTDACTRPRRRSRPAHHRASTRDGRVLCDSDRVVGRVGSDVADVPEVRAALTAGTGAAPCGRTGRRASAVAVRRRPPGARAGRHASCGRRSTLGATHDTVARGALVPRLGLLVARSWRAAVALGLARRMLPPAAAAGGLRQQARRRRGARRTSRRSAPTTSGELEAQLGEMARRVGGTIGELRVERERLEAILRGMVEGVLVTDLHGRRRAAERPRPRAARRCRPTRRRAAARWSS